VWAFEADVTQEDQAGRAVEGAAAAAGRLDILINNAGGNLRKPPQDYALDEWRRLLDDNLTSAFLCSRAAHPHLKRSGRGKVVNIGSMTSVLGAGWAAPYSAAKGGIRLFTKSLAVAWAGDGIQVNCLMPGFIDTDLSRAARVAVPGLERRVLDRTPAGRWGRPEDLVGTAVFLCSPASDFVTGTEIAVDGGYSAAL
jgi:2-deoxy-D-gluconate 3-dehydrogenase